MKHWSPRVLVISMAITSGIAGILQLTGISIFKFPAESIVYRLDSIITHTLPLGLLHACLLAVNMTLMICIVARKSYRWEIGVLTFILSCVLQIKDDARVEATLLVFFIALWICGNLKEVVVRFVNILVITTLYQPVASFYKFGLIPSIRDFTPGQIVLYSIDNLIFLVAIYYDTKGGKENAERNPLMDLVYPCFRFTARNPKTAQKAPESFQLTNLDRILMVLVAIFQLGLIAAAVTINNRFIIFLIVYLFGFFPQKLATGFNYHAETLGACTIQSLIAFYVACAIVPQVGVSVLLPVCSGTAIVAVIFIIEHWRSFKPKIK